MALEPYQLVGNANIDIDGSEGHVLQTDATLTYVSRDSGKVDVYTTEHVRNNATVVATPAEQEAAANDPQAQRIADLEAQLAAARGDAPVSNTVTAPASTEQTTPARQQTA